MAIRSRMSLASDERASRRKQWPILKFNTERPRLRPADKEVEAAVAQARIRDRQQTLEEFQANIRHARAKARDRVRQERHRNPRGDSNRELALRGASQGAHSLLGACHLREDQPGVNEQRLAVLRERDA